MNDETKFLADVAARHAAHAAQIASALRLALDNVDTDDEEADAIDDGLNALTKGGTS